MESIHLNHAMVLNYLPERPVESHKGDYGKVLLLCGSKGYTGAAALAAMGALRSGAGLVYLGVPESIYAIEAVKLTEPIIFPLPDRNGMLAAEAKDRVLSILPDMNAVLIGPGLGRSEDVEHIVCEVVRTCQCPMVLDADGINSMIGHKDILRGRAAATVLTPHAGEFYRIAGFHPEDRVESAALLAKELNSIVLLKGHESVITDGQTVYINPTGNPGLATGGSGDVLAGIIVSLIGQGIEPLKAASCAACVR